MSYDPKETTLSLPDATTDQTPDTADDTPLIPTDDVRDGDLFPDDDYDYAS